MNLLPCPFCGSNNIEVRLDNTSDHKEDWFYIVECQDCDVYRNRADAIDAWNRRTDKALRECLVQIDVDYQNKKAELPMETHAMLKALLNCESC